MRSVIQKLTFSTCLLLFTTLSFAQKKVCITIDDLPVVGYGMNSIAEWALVTDRILSTCEAKGIPAIGYVNETKIYLGGELNEERAAILESWLKRGFDLGNHTFSHADFHKIGIEAFKKEIIKGERYSKTLLPKYGKQLKYFRHPYLRSGASEETSHSLDAYLKEKNYTPAPVTLDSDDYLFAQRYARAMQKGDSARMKEIGETYVKHTENKLQFYEKLSEAVFDRNIAHTYLMHANLLNGDYLDEIAEMFKRNGYEFVSQEEVLQDPAYNEPVTKFGNWGMSWLYRWALSRDKGRELFKQDIELPAIVK